MGRPRPDCRIAAIDASPGSMRLGGFEALELPAPVALPKREAQPRVRGTDVVDAARPEGYRVRRQLVANLADLDHRHVLICDADVTRAAVEQAGLDVDSCWCHSHDCHLVASRHRTSVHTTYRTGVRLSTASLFGPWCEFSRSV